jgi:hypothetical protein
MNIDFKPSDVALGLPIPLIGCFKSSESELMAAMMVRALVRDGDEWKPITPHMVGLGLKQDVAEDFPGINGVYLGIVRPHPHAMIPAFARWTAPKGTPNRPLEFTDKAIDVFRTQVRPKGLDRGKSDQTGP